MTRSFDMKRPHLEPDEAMSASDLEYRTDDFERPPNGPAAQRHAAQHGEHHDIAPPKPGDAQRSADARPIRRKRTPAERAATVTRRSRP
jgi:hypothetical protein